MGVHSWFSAASFRTWGAKRRGAENAEPRREEMLCASLRPLRLCVWFCYPCPSVVSHFGLPTVPAKNSTARIIRLSCPPDLMHESESEERLPEAPPPKPGEEHPYAVLRNPDFVRYLVGRFVA